MLLFSLVATFISQSSDGVAGTLDKPSKLQSLPNVFHLPMSRGEPSSNIPSSTGNPKAGHSGPRGGRRGQKRRHSASGGSENGQGDGNGKPKGQEEEMSDALFQAIKKPFMCPYYCRRPDMWAECGKFRFQGGREFHRLKAHLYEAHLLKYLCESCNQGFELEDKYEEHRQICQAERPRDYLLGFDKVQDDQLRAMSSPTSRLRGKLKDKDKWELIYQIVFPDVEKSGIPDPSYEPNMRDTIRYGRWLELNNINFCFTPDDVSSWQRTQPSNDLSLGQFDQPGRSPNFQAQIHDAPADGNAHWAGTFTRTQDDDIRRTHHLFPDGSSCFAPSSVVGGHERSPAVENRQSYHSNMHTMSQLNDMTENFLSPPPRWAPPSDISSGELPPSQGGMTWGSSAAQDSAPYSQASGFSQVALHSPLPEFLYSELDQPQFSGPSEPGLEDQLQIGALFPPDTGQSKKVKPPG